VDYSAYPFLPQGDSLTLLEAALHPELPQAQEAWNRWRGANTLEDCPLTEHRLLPLIFRRLQNQGLSPADQRILRGVYRFHWTRNQLALRAAQQAVVALQQAGISCLVLKGLALLLHTYQDRGVRPMWDFDLLVHPDRRDDALDALASLGWTSPVPAPDLSAKHSHHLVQEGGLELDLHWCSLHQSRWLNADDDFWAASQPLALSDAVEMRCLCPEHNFLHICVHGVNSDTDNPLRWVCDARQILATHPLDWEKFLRAVKQHRVVLTTRLGLGYLREVVRAPVPEAVLQRLAEMPVGWHDRLYFETQVQQRSLLHYWALPCLEYLRFEARPSLAGFLDYLRRRWGLSSFVQLPFSGLVRLRRRLLQKLSRTA
jgi:hypothetical protein